MNVREEPAEMVRIRYARHRFLKFETRVQAVLR
jgi:hypothetical protein